MCHWSIPRCSLVQPPDDIAPEELEAKCRPCTLQAQGKNAALCAFGRMEWNTVHNFTTNKKLGEGKSSTRNHSSVLKLWSKSVESTYTNACAIFLDLQVPCSGQYSGSPRLFWWAGSGWECKHTNLHPTSLFWLNHCGFQALDFLAALRPP